jgi:putative SOS response-associated peptidase YedK
MCGRYAQTADMRELMEQFSVTGSSPESSLPLNWNIAPTNPIYIVRANDQSGNDASSEKALAVVSWGLIGSLADRFSRGTRFAITCDQCAQ